MIHAKELKRTTNTGTLALRALTHSELRVRGRNFESNWRLDLSDLLGPDIESLLYYPSGEALELTPEYVARIKKPIQLIVPDGNWRQASKVHTRHKELAEIPRVMIKDANLAEHHLRAESTSYGMSTLEAIARALGVIEGQQVQDVLLQLYQDKLQATLVGRGIVVTGKKT